MTTQFTITKRIAKHGKQSIIVVPSILSEQLKPKTLVEINIIVIEEEEKRSGEKSNDKRKKT
jgi:hypothetical protein